MAQELSDLCLDNLDEFINDENKQVTYKWLSQTLSIHVNLAKQLLYSFVDLQRNKKDNDTLSVTYVLSGVTKCNGSSTHKVQIVPEEKLEAAKTAFSVLTSCHVYSVQKGKLKNPNTLFMSDYEVLKQNLLKTNNFSAIKCPAAQLRDEVDMERFAQVRAPEKAPVAQKQNGVSTGSRTSANAKPSKPTGIAGMFAAKPKAKPSESKTDTDNKVSESTSSDSKDNKAKSKGKASGGVMSFFAKQSAKPKDDTTHAAVKMESESPEPKAERTKPENRSKSSPEKLSSKTDATKRGVKHKDRSEDEAESRQKKKKRVKVQVESSSEEEDDIAIDSPIPSPAPPEPEEQDAVMSSPEMIPPSPEPQRPSPKKTSRPAAEDNDMCGKIKKRKLVSKTFVNDEGFMVTEKVWEDEWEDAPEPAKKTSPEKPKDTKDTNTKSKKNPSPGKKISPSKQSGKQTSLMNFFKKK